MGQSLYSTSYETDTTSSSSTHRYTGGRIPYDERSELIHLIVGPHQTSIDAGAFHHCTALQSAQLPHTLRHIGCGAFSNCESLVSLRIPHAVTTIAEEAFFSCAALTSVRLPDTITVLARHTFRYCSSLTSVRLPDRIEQIERGAFSSCSSLTSVRLPASLRVIGDEAFCDCLSLTNLYLPDGVQEIGSAAFLGCCCLVDVVLPAGLVSFGDDVFSNCASLVSVTLPAQVQKLGGSSSRRCSSSATCFYGCRSITNVDTSLSPLSKSHHSTNANANANARRLFSEAIQSMTPEHKLQWIRTKNPKNHRSALMNAASLSLRWWEDTKEIFEANMPAIEETDAVTGLSVSLLAAVGPDSDLESVYWLCRECPAVLVPR